MIAYFGKIIARSDHFLYNRLHTIVLEVFDKTAADTDEMVVILLGQFVISVAVPQIHLAHQTGLR